MSLNRITILWLLIGFGAWVLAGIMPGLFAIGATPFVIMCAACAVCCQVSASAEEQYEDNEIEEEDNEIEEQKAPTGGKEAQKV